MANYQEVRIKLRNTQLNKIKSGIILRIDKKISRWRIATWIICNKKSNHFAKNMSTDVILSKAQISKII